MDIRNLKKVNIKLNRKNIIIAVVCIIILFITIAIVVNKNKTIDISNAEHYITIAEDVVFYKKAETEDVKIYKTLELGTKIYVLETFEEDGTSWSKVVVDNKKGYIITEKLGKFTESDDDEVLMLDVSQFNYQNSFNTAGEFSYFLISNNIQYVYIRAGGRGYGSEGNFYIDSYYQMWADECEFLQIPFGFYFLDEAIDSDEVDEEVEFIQNFLQENSYEYNTLPVALDIEKHEVKGRADSIWDTRSELVTELIEKLENIEIETLIYSNAITANDYLSEIDTKFWIAYYPELDYGEIPDYWYSDTDQDPTENKEFTDKIIAWQFTEEGVLGLIDDEVDLSLIYRFED